ncbi:MAG: hypothetical protein OQK04_17315, partial [Kangiellaceae bacterium]|nr:hypothetical protein [Kangiellaceae bacterium]
EQELVFALGEEELKVEFGEDKQLEFKNLEHLASLDVEDYFSLRLYNNNDPGNILWEYAFEYLSIYTPQDFQSEYEEIHDDIVYLSADEPTLKLESMIVGYQDREDKEPISVSWLTNGDGTFSNPSETNNEGIFRSTLTMPTSAGARATPSVKIAESETEAEFTEVVVLPGKTASVTLSTTSSNAHAQGVGTTVIEATASDQYGNLVLDGTPIKFSVSGKASIVSRDKVTTGGKASMTVRGGWYSGSDNWAIAQVHNVESAPTMISISPLGIEIIGLPSQLVTGQTYDFRAKITGSGDLEGKFVDSMFDKGKVLYDNFATDPSGELTLKLKVGKVTGQGKVMLKADGSNVSTQSVTIVSQNPSKEGKAHTFVSRDSTSPLNFSDINGASFDMDTPSSIEVSVSGQSNESITVRLDDKFNPNHAPKLDLSINYYVNDRTSNHVIEAEDLFTIADATSPQGFALEFKSQNSADVILDESLDINNLAGVLSIKSERRAAEIVNIGGDAISVSTNSSGNFEVTILTDSGAVVATSPIAANDSWQQVAFGISEGNVYIKVGEQLVTSPVTGNVTSSGNSLKIEEFTGFLGELRLFDLSDEKLLRFDNGQTSQEITLDGAGLGSVNLEQAAYLDSSTPRASVGLINDELQLDVITILSEQTTRQYAALVQNVFASNYDYTEFHNLIAPAIDDPRHDAVAGLVFDIASDSQTFTPLRLVTATLSYLHFNSESESMGEALDLLIRFYVNHANVDLQYAFADYFSDKIKKLRHGERAPFKFLLTTLVVWAELIIADPEIAQLVGESVHSKEDIMSWSLWMSLPAQGWWGTDIPAIPLDQTCLDTASLNSPYAGHETLSAIPLCRMDGARLAGMLRGVYSGNEMQNLIDSNPNLLVEHAREWTENMIVATPEIRFLLNQGTYTSVNQANNITLGIEEAHAVGPAGPIAGAVVAGVIFAAKESLQLAARLMIKLSKKYAVNFQHFVAGRSNSRINPFVMIMIMGYLEDRMSEDCLSDSDCAALGAHLGTADRQKLWEQVDGLIIRTLVRIALSRNFQSRKKQESGLGCYMTFHYHGMAFELLQIAYYHGYSEFVDTSKGLVNAIQKTYNIALVQKVRGSNPTSYKVWTEFERDIDLELLKGNEKVWVEAKSVRAYPADTPTDKRGLDGTKPNKALDDTVNAHWPQWKIHKSDELTSGGNKRQTSAHRQIFLDRVALAPVLSNPGGGPPIKPKQVDQILWNIHSWPECYRNLKKFNDNKSWFHDVGVSFKRGTSITNRGKTYCKDHEGPKNDSSTDEDFKYLRKQIALLPEAKARSAKKAVILTNLSFEKGSDNDRPWASSDVNDVFKPFSVFNDIFSVEKLKDEFEMGTALQLAYESLAWIDIELLQGFIDLIPRIPWDSIP